MRWGEFQVGQVFETSEAVLAEAEIRRFAEQFDRQPLHLDPEFAKGTRFGAIIASGMHTLAATWQLWLDLGLQVPDGIAGTGMEHLHWLGPVFAGDRLRATIEVIAMSPRGERSGNITMKFTTRNQSDTVVLDFEVASIYAR